MKKYVPLDAILSIDVEQRIIELAMEQRRNFTQKQILREVSVLFPFVIPSELSDEVKKILSDLLKNGVIKIHSQTCTPEKEIYYIIK